MELEKLLIAILSLVAGILIGLCASNSNPSKTPAKPKIIGYQPINPFPGSNPLPPPKKQRPLDRQIRSASEAVGIVRRFGKYDMPEGAPLDWQYYWDDDKTFRYTKRVFMKTENGTDFWWSSKQLRWLPDMNVPPGDLYL